MTQKSCRTVRRSVALPCDLVEEAQAVAPPELRDNFNRLVHRALLDFTAAQREKAMEQAMAEMAADPAIRRECAAISTEFLASEDDGLQVE
jgi:hypothetical protein